MAARRLPRDSLGWSSQKFFLVFVEEGFSSDWDFHPALVESRGPSAGSLCRRLKGLKYEKYRRETLPAPTNMMSLSSAPRCPSHSAARGCVQGLSRANQLFLSWRGGW